MKTTFRTKVFKRAWEISKQTGKAFLICLIKAWQVYRLKKRMLHETVKFAFEKVDGSIRYAFGTLADLKTSTTNKTRKPNFKTLAYFDTQSGGFRCFRVENLVRVY